MAKKKRKGFSKQILFLIIFALICFSSLFLYFRNQKPYLRFGYVKTQADSLTVKTEDGITPFNRPYYFSTTNGIWRKDPNKESAVLAFRALNDNESAVDSHYAFKIIDEDIFAVVYTEGTTENRSSFVYECMREPNGGSHYCGKISETYYQGHSDGPLIAKLDGVSEYVFLRKKGMETSWFGGVMAQVPQATELVRRNYEKNTITHITDLEEEAGCGGGSWHPMYYHGYERNILTTDYGRVFLQVGCEGYPGAEGRQYIINTKNGEKVKGSFDYIKPIVVTGYRMAFHRVQIPEMESKVYLTDLVRLDEETELFTLPQNKKVTDLGYDYDTYTLYTATIQQPAAMEMAEPQSTYTLGLTAYSLDNYSPPERIGTPSEVYTTEGYYIDNLIATKQGLLFTVYNLPEDPQRRQQFGQYDATTYLLDPETNKVTMSAPYEIQPATPMQVF